ncbi:NAD-dependent epimerase/dehydratase family protein [Candidatus Daviesbacteria bacterium]|nr:NAD-dependent epimerase/dehydratase family protein [Candidatus Daviesbacteria bacterium]
MKTLQEFIQEYYSTITVLNCTQLKDKTILITGASGLIGSNLVAYLDFLNEREKLNLKIIAIHRSSRELWMPQSATIRYIQRDLTKNELLKNLKFQYLIHCATYAQPKKFLEYPKETVSLNIDVLFDLLEQSEKNRAIFLYLSSAEVYGEADKTHVPTKETYFGNVNTLTDRAIYSESKRLAETICYLFSKKIKIKIARALIAYGPGVKYDDKRVISEFIKKAQEAKEIIMMDEGLAERTFCFITDMIEVLLNIMLNGREIVYNACGKETTTIKNLAKLIAQINQAKFNNKFKERAVRGTPLILTLDNNRYLSEFKKKTFVSLNEGLVITSEWFRNLKQ